ncbi:hypothetical protein EPN96_02400 [bacterium]|nr:MAG: hypothetical protein EPN96_02400 [bacterium]
MPMQPTNDLQDPDIAQLLRALESLTPTIRTFREGNLLGMCIGGVAFLSGALASFLGLSGSVDWIFRAGSISSKLVNASPGVIFAAMGMIIMLRYKPRVRTEVEINVNRSHSVKNPDIKTMEASIRYTGTASTPISSK